MKYYLFKMITIAIACLGILSFAALPEMRITTKDNKDVLGVCSGMEFMGTCMGTQTYSYFTMTNFQLTGHSARNSTLDSIKVRGNSTANAAKKPYKIKFGAKTSLFDKESAKSWVLLANFYDGTFALNAVAFEMGKRMGLEFTNSSQFVDLYINNQYKGIYQLTEQIQSNKGRVDISEKNKGWLVEFDYHDPEQDERLSYFKTSKYDLGTFIKAPELDEMENKTDSTQLRFVKTDINNLVNKMAESGFPTNGYRDLIDLQSFAKYVLIQLVMDNFDFNNKTQTGALPGSNFAYKINNISKIQAGPLWDFDLAAGVTMNNFPKHYSTYQDPITPTHAFYKRLWEDDVFKAKYRKIWTKHKKDFEAMSALIDSIKNVVRGSVNNNQWNSGTLNTQTFDSEISSLKTWWTNRLTYVEQQLASIDTTKDIVELTPIACQQIAGGNKIFIVKNSVNLQVKKFARFEIYNLNGRLEKSMNFTSGVYNVPLEGLPKGMYVAKVSFGDGVKILRVPVM
jgi:hypothetical protein